MIQTKFALFIIRTSLVFLLLAACSSHDSTEGHSFEIFTDENGVIQAVNRGGPKYPGELFLYEEVLRLIQDEEKPESLISTGFTGWYRGSDGYFYVEDKGRIAVFDAEGRFRYSIGKEGFGPGEFTFGEILSIEDDRLTIFDPIYQRASIYATDGTLLKSFSFFESPFFLAAFHIGPQEESLFISLSQGIYFGDPWVGPQINRRVAFILSATGDTLAHIDTDPVTVGYRSRDFTAKRYFSGRPYILYRPQTGLVVCCGGEPVVEIFDLQGTLRQRILIQDDPIPVSNEDRREILSDLRQRMQNAENPRTREMYEWKLDNLEIPKVRDFCSKMLVDEAGYIWLEIPYYPAMRGRIQLRMPTFRVLNAGGEYLGDTETPTPEGQFSHGMHLTLREDPETGQVDFIAYWMVPAVEGLKYP